MNFRIFAIFVLLFVLISSFSLYTSAEVGTFSVTPVFPDNQNPDTHGFFDLLVLAGTRQEIAVEVSNASSEYINVSLSIFNAGTNRNGIVDYTGPGIEDTSMQNPLDQVASIASGFEIVEVPPGGAVLVPITLDIPNRGFDGIILGSISALLETPQENGVSPVMIVNRFAHAIVVRLQENGTPIGTDFQLGEVSAQLVNHRASIVAEIRNTQPRLVMGALAHSQIYPIGGDTAVFARSDVSVDFAPNTVFEFTMLDEAGAGLDPGDYLAHIQIEHGGVTWEFEREFEILPQLAQEINTTAINIQQQQIPFAAGSSSGDDNTLIPGISNTHLTLIIAGLLLIVILVLFIVVSRHKKQARRVKAFRARMRQIENKVGR